VRIIGGAWRGRTLISPAGATTRPTADRVRQALFDMLLHAPWGGRQAIEGSRVLDTFAGTGALGLEALSRGADHATFMDTNRAALAATRANIAACRAGDRCEILIADATAPPPGTKCGLVFLDPPYGEGLVPRAVAALKAAGWIAPAALIVAEIGRYETAPEVDAPLVDRAHGAARIVVWRAP
jgi:16S rRNA (guanine966-N2)-methyltransferase